MMEAEPASETVCVYKKKLHLKLTGKGKFPRICISLIFEL
jgi:hypothetical protein